MRWYGRFSEQESRPHQEVSPFLDEREIFDTMQQDSLRGSSVEYWSDAELISMAPGQGGRTNREAQKHFEQRHGWFRNKNLNPIRKSAPTSTNEQSLTPRSAREVAPEPPDLRKLRGGSAQHFRFPITKIYHTISPQTTNAQTKHL